MARSGWHGESARHSVAARKSHFRTPNDPTRTYSKGRDGSFIHYNCGGEVALRKGEKWVCKKCGQETASILVDKHGVGIPYDLAMKVKRKN